MKKLQKLNYEDLELGERRREDSREKRNRLSAHDSFIDVGRELSSTSSYGIGRGVPEGPGRGRQIAKREVAIYANPLNW